jgi:hypothetical protein
MTRSRDLANLADGVEFLAADHTKLDGIETAATADQTNAEIRTAVEAASDSNVFTDADHSKLNAVEASSDVTDTANVTAAGALMDSELTNLAAVKAINQSLVTTATPTFAGLGVNGTVTADGLTVSGSTSTVPIRIDNTGTGGDTWRIWSTNDAASDGGGKLGFYNEDTSTRAMTLDSAGNVGIGTSSPNAVTNYTGLTLNNSTYGGFIDIENNGTHTFRLLSNTSATYITTIESDPLVFSTANTERMRILGDGNVLFHKTATDGGQVGVQITPSGALAATRAGGAPIYFRRNTNVGDIVQFNYAGTSVGSIGTISNDLLIGTDDTGLRFYDAGNAIIPRTAAGGNVNGTIDLGGPSSINSQFKDLYLSGGVYLGGTGAANKLTDFEVGSWTPSFNGYTTGFQGRYTKIGNLVTCRITRWASAASGSMSGNIEITGLPFTAGINEINNSGSGQNTHQMHIRASSGGQANAPWGIVYVTTLKLHMPTSFGSSNVYATTAATYPASKITQNGTTAILIDYTFTYRT